MGPQAQLHWFLSDWPVGGSDLMSLGILLHS